MAISEQKNCGHRGTMPIFFHLCWVIFLAVYKILKSRSFCLLHFSASAASVSENSPQMGSTGNEM